MANPIVTSIEDARAYFASHSYINPLIEACNNEEQTLYEKAKAMQLLAETIRSMFPSSDVSQLLEEANMLVLENTLKDEFSIDELS